MRVAGTMNARCARVDVKTAVWYVLKREEKLTEEIRNEAPIDGIPEVRRGL